MVRAVLLGGLVLCGLVQGRRFLPKVGGDISKFLPKYGGVFSKKNNMFFLKAICCVWFSPLTEINPASREPDETGIRWTFAGFLHRI